MACDWLTLHSNGIAAAIAKPLSSVTWSNNSTTKEKMMKRTISVLLAQSVAATLLLGCGLLAMAQEDVRVDTKVNAGQRGQRDVIKLTTILKSKVLIQEDRPAGTIVDVVLTDGGCVEYFVASYDNQFYVVPYAATQVRYADQVIFLDIAPAQFQKVTFFSGNRWPDLYAPAFRTQLYSFYGVTAPRIDVDVNVNRNNRNRADNDPNADPATPAPRKTLKPELPDTPSTTDPKKPRTPETTPDVKKPKAAPGDQPLPSQPKKEVIPPTPDKKPVVPPTPNPIPKDPKEVPKPKLPQ